MPSEPFWWNYHGFSFFVLFVCNNHIYKVQHFICFCPLHVQVILPLFFFSLYRMHQMKLLPSYREFQIWSLATIVMGILLHLYYLIRWELRRFSMIILLFAFFMWEHIIFFPFVFFFFVVWLHFMSSAILLMLWRKQNIQSLIYIGENLRISTISQANLLLI